MVCDVRYKEVVRGNLPKHKRSQTCQRIAEERLRERMQKLLDDADSSSGEDACQAPIVASREVCNQMWGETKAPDFDFDKWFARWCPDDGQTVCYTFEDETERWC